MNDIVAGGIVFRKHTVQEESCICEIKYDSILLHLTYIHLKLEVEADGREIKVQGPLHRTWILQH